MFVHFQLTGCLFIININFLHSKIQKIHWQKVSTASLENGTDDYAPGQILTTMVFPITLFTFDTGHLRMEFLYNILIVYFHMNRF